MPKKKNTPKDWGKFNFSEAGIMSVPQCLHGQSPAPSREESEPSKDQRQCIIGPIVINIMTTTWHGAFTVVACRAYRDPGGTNNPKS